MSEQAGPARALPPEARAVAQLSHPHVVTVIDAGEDDGHPYIVFEYVEGETLKQRIQRLGRAAVAGGGRLRDRDRPRPRAPPTRASIVHRDVKPQNVLIDAEGRAKVTDFGIARQLEQDGLTATGRVLGTTDYVAPEQAMGQDVDPRSDIYSLGIVLYEMLTGDVPFKADSQVGVAMKHVHEELPDVQRRRPEVSAAVARWSSARPPRTPRAATSDVDEMVDDLETRARGRGGAGGRRPTGEATSVLDAVPPPRRRLAARRALVVGGDRAAGRWSAAGALAAVI